MKSVSRARNWVLVCGEGAKSLIGAHFCAGALMVIKQISQESHGFVKIFPVVDEDAAGGNNANTSAEWSWWFEIEIDRRCAVIVDFSDTGEMGDRHTAADEVVGDKKVVAFNSYSLNWPRPYKPKRTRNAP